MPDLRQALRDFVATSNSGKYATEEELMSKFPELKGYDTQVLRDFVATSNSGKYATEDELFSKFPEFNQGTQVKKKFALESSSEVGSSEPQKSPNQRTDMPVLTQQGFEQAMSQEKSTPKDMSGKPLLDVKKAKETKTILDKITAENKQLEVEKKKYEDIFDKQLNIKPKVEDSKYLKDRLSAVNTELFTSEEEFVVPELQYQFGDLGFKFEETGMTGDYVIATAPNGKKIELSVDNLFDSKNKSEAIKLQNFVKENTPAKALYVLENTMRAQDKKFNSEKQVDDEVKVITDEVTNLNKRQKEFLAKKAQFEKELDELPKDAKTLELLEKKRQDLLSEMKSIIDDEERIQLKGRKLDTAVGKYGIAKAKQGTWGGAIWDSFLGGIGKMASGLTSLPTDIATEIAPTGYGMSKKDLKDISVDISKKLGIKGPTENQTIDQWKKTLTEDELDAWEDEVDDYIKKDLKSKTLPYIRIGAKEVFGDPGTTQQFEDLKKESFWGGAILGLSESLPAMIGGSGPVGWAQRTAQMYGQVTDNIYKEMEDDPDFANISENEKLAIAAPIGIVSSVLEAYGFRNVMQSKGMVNSIAMSVIGKSGKTTTAKTFRELVENEVESRLAKGLLVMGAGGMAEFETGFLQEGSEVLAKDIYNEIKGKDMFQTPESIQDVFENMVVSGAQEAVGGFILGTPSAVSAAYSEKGFLKMDDASFETFANMANDEKLQSAYIANLKERISRGLITTAEAKTELNDYRNSVGLFRQLPPDLNTQQKKEAMNLLKEKRDLEAYVEGKDPALVVKQKNRIAEINESLTKLSETNAVQEQSTTAIPVQSETGISETMEGGTPEAKPEIVTEQGTQEEVIAPQTIIEAMQNPADVFVYDGKKGQLTTIGQTVVLETPTEIIDLGNVDELSDSTLADFGIQKEEELDFTLNEDNSVVINGKTYLNNYSNPEAAISQDKDGNYSVTLDTENGQKRTFRGQQADQIVYQMKLKNFEQNGTEQDIDAAIELADEAIRIEEEVRQPSAEREGKSVRKGKRKQRTLRQPKEPLTKAEREAIAPVESKPQVGLVNPLVNVEETTKALMSIKFKDVEKLSNIIGETINKDTKINIKNNSAITNKGKQIKFRITRSTDPEIDTDFLKFTAIDNNGNEVGYAIFIDNGNNNLEGSEVNIQPKQQNLGIASAIYYFADAKGYNITPSSLQTPEGKAFWSSLKRKKGNIQSISKAYHKAKKDGSNPELVEAVEALLAPKVTEQATQTEVAPVQPAPKIDLGEDIAQQVGLPPAPEGFDIVSEPAPSVEVKAEEAVVEKPTERETFEEMMDRSRREVEAIQSEVDEFNSVNNRAYKGKTKKELENDLYEVRQKLYDAQKNISRAEDADEAIAEYNKAKENVANVENQIQEFNNFNKVSGFVFDQIDSSKKSNYEFIDLFNQDPRLAAIQDAKEMIEWLESQEGREEDVAKYKNDVELLEKDIKKYPLKAKAETKSEAAPIKKESKIDKKIVELESDLDFYQRKIEDTQEEIDIEKQNTKEGVAEIRKKISEALKDKSIPKAEKTEIVEDLKAELENFKDEQEAIIEQYKDDLKDYKSEFKKAEKKLAKLSAPVSESVDDLLNLDTTDKTNLQRVLDFLDKADESLNLDPNELNDVTRVMAVNTAKVIVRTLRTLVNASMTLQEAIKKVSEIYSITPDKIIDALDIVSKINQNKSEGISEMEAPGYNQLAKEVDNMIDNDATIDEVLEYVQESDVYKNATDVQKELFVREVRGKFGLRQKSAPSVGKLFGKLKDVKRITMREKDLLIKQFKDQAKGARESIQAWKKQSQELTKELADLVKAGKITNTQSSVILKRFSKVNIFSEKSVDRFVDYMTKVFNDSNYKKKLSDARESLSSLKKLSKNKETNGNLRDIASQFVKIDPSIVTDIDAYNDIAQRLKVALKGSKTLGADVRIADTINIDEVSSYIDNTLESQEEILKQEKIQEIKDLLGIDVSTFSDEEIDALLESDETLSKDNGKIVRAKIKKAFDIYSSVIEEMLSTGIDPFTGEEIEFSDKQKDLIKRFMSIDVNDIKKTKEALKAVDSLINFIQNKSTAGMLKSIANFEGPQGGKKAFLEGLIAKPLRKYFSKKLGLALGQKVTALPVLFDKMFKGVTRALKVEEFIGLSDLINNASKAESETNNIVKKYVKQFYDKKANGEKFNTAYNDIERGVFAHVYRNVIGPDSRVEKVFEKRKQEVLDAITLLTEKGNDSEVKIAELLQKAYDKLLKDSKNIEEVKSKTDATNVEAVDFWINEWSDKFEDLSDLSINFYNKVLGKDLNYTPDKVRRLQDDTRDVDLEDVQSQFFANTDDILYDKKSGNLMDKQENRKIPKSMYIDFSFDKKNANSMNDALTDLYTAFDISKVGSFLRSDSFRKIFPSAKDARLIDNRIKKFVRLTRKKTPFSNDDISDVLKGADKIAKLGVTAALASPSQPFKQVVPVMFNTAASGGSIGLGIITNKGFNNWINNLGYAISNRGAESQAQIDSLNKLIEQAADMPVDKAIRFIEKVNDKALKTLLVNPDVWVARASFKAYYEQSLKKQGLKSSGIDYNNHEVNKEAANYAQRMVDRQQNISNANLAGDLFTSESKSSKIFIKMLMPFSSFRLNQAARLGADLTTLEYWNTSTREDKVIAMRSIAGYALEAATYRILQIGISLAMYSAAKAFLGVGDDDEEDKKYLNNLIKGASSSLFLDTFSPIPLGDPLMQDALAFTVDEVENLMGRSEEEKIKLFGSSEQSFLKLMGTYGIPISKAKDLYTLGSLAYTRKYKDRFGNEKEIGQAEADKLKLLIAPLFTASILGVASPDMTSIANKSIKISKNQKDTSKEFLKERYPERYKRIYGDDEKESSVSNRQKEREERIKDRIKRRFGTD